MADEHSTQKGQVPPENRDSEGTERVREVVRDGFYTMLGAASWAFEKTDEMAHNWLHQGRTSGDESRRRFRCSPRHMLEPAGIALPARYPAAGRRCSHSW